MYIYMVLFRCGDYHNILLNERMLLLEKKKKISKILLSTVLTVLLTFSVSAVMDGPEPPPVEGYATASSSGASTGIDLNPKYWNEPHVESYAAIGNTFGWAHDSGSGVYSSSASVSDSELDNLSQAPVQASRAYSYLNGKTEYEKYWSAN